MHSSGTMFKMAAIMPAPRHHNGDEVIAEPDEGLEAEAHKANRACTRSYASNSAIAASSESAAWIAGSKTFVEMGRPLTFTAALMAETNRSHTS